MIHHDLFKAQDVTPAKDDGLISSIMRVLKSQPEIGRALEQEERVAAHAEMRPAIVAELEKNRSAAAKHIAELAAAEKKTRVELEAIEPRYEAVAAAWRKAKEAADFARYESNIAENRLLDQLEAHADPIIDETYNKLCQLWADFQSDRQRYFPPESHSRRERRGGRRVRIYLTNRPSLEKWSEAVVKGMRDLLAMKRDPDQSNLAERCAAYLDLPDWEKIVEVEVPV